MTLQLIRSFITSIFLSPYHHIGVIVARICKIIAATPRNTMPPPKFYHDDEVWKDVEPLPQDDGGMHPLAAIAYTKEYSEAMDYLRAVMANNEFSERVLGLTEHIINMNPAHYTVWYVAPANTIGLHGMPPQTDNLQALSRKNNITARQITAR